LYHYHDENNDISIICRFCFDVFIVVLIVVVVRAEEVDKEE